MIPALLGFAHSELNDHVSKPEETTFLFSSQPVQPPQTAVNCSSLALGCFTEGRNPTDSADVLLSTYTGLKEREDSWSGRDQEEGEPGWD